MTLQTRINEINGRLTQARGDLLAEKVSLDRLKGVTGVLADCLTEAMALLRSIAGVRPTRERSIASVPPTHGQIARLQPDEFAKPQQSSRWERWLKKKTGLGPEDYKQKVVETLARNRMGLLLSEIREEIQFPNPDGWPNKEIPGERKLLADFFRRQIMVPLLGASQVRMVGATQGATYFHAKTKPELVMPRQNMHTQAQGDRMKRKVRRRAARESQLKMIVKFLGKQKAPVSCTKLQKAVERLVNPQWPKDKFTRESFHGKFLQPLVIEGRILVTGSGRWTRYGLKSLTRNRPRSSPLVGLQWLQGKTNLSLEDFKPLVLKTLALNNKGLSAQEIRKQVGFPSPDGKKVEVLPGEDKAAAAYFMRKVLGPLVKESLVRQAGAKRGTIYFHA